MTKWFDTALPCPCGKSSDAYAIDVEGDGYCFSCGKYFKDKDGEELSDQSEENAFEEYVDENEPKGKQEYDLITHRKISKKTIEFYNVFTKLINGQPYCVGYPYPNASLKVRILPKTFYSSGPIGEAHLFAENLFPPGSKDSITITEGEDDAMSVWEMLQGNTAGVSVKNAQTAFGDIKARRDYINSFKKIVLCLDNDKAGRQATNLIVNSGLFDYEKLYIVNFPSDKKDAHEYLFNEQTFDFRKLWESARRYMPSSIINSFEDVENALKKKQDEPLGVYPFDGLNESLISLCKGELILIKGLEGIGKTEVCRAITFDFLKNTEHNVANIFLEEDESVTIKGVATYELGYPCNLRNAEVSNDDVMRGYRRALGDNESRLYIHKHISVGSGIEDLVDNIRFLVTVGGCKLVLLDNLTMLTTGREGEDERLKIDQIIRRLRDLVNELHFCLVLVAHINDQGQTRGSRLPDKLANTVIFMNRDLKAQHISEKNLIHFWVEKSRGQGTTTGDSGKAFFDPISFRLRNILPEDNILMPPSSNQ